jgi:hypothetical protein
MLTVSPQKSARGVCGFVPDYQALTTWDEAERKRRQTSSSLARDCFRAALRARAAHIVSFRPVGIEQLARQRTPHALGSPKPPAKQRRLQR